MNKKDKEKIRKQMRYISNSIEWLKEDFDKLKRILKRNKIKCSL